MNRTTRIYRATSMAAALAQIRAELGPDALIVDSRWVPRRLGFLKPRLEVTATTESSTSAGPALGPLPEGEAGCRPEGPRTGEGLSSALSPQPSALSTLKPLWNTLRSQGVEEELALQLLTAAVSQGDPAAWVAPSYGTIALTAEIEHCIPTVGPLSLGTGPSVFAIVGPTGVGKTTTIAKLAAGARNEGWQVAMVTIDTHRVGAAQQLATYAEIIGLPFSVAYSRRELEEIVAQMPEGALVLVDTPGCSPRNAALIAEVRDVLAAVPTCRVHLALASGAHYTTMLDIAAAFADLPTSGIILTKLDEAQCMGPAVSLLSKIGKPVSYLTTGQSVPTDIEVATAKRLAQLIVGNEAAA